MSMFRRDSIALYFRYVTISIASQLQYRASFVMQSIGHFLVTGIEFLGIWALFSRFGALSGWSLAEVACFYGSIQISFALADALGRGFDVFSAQVKSGTFDRLLLRPRSTVLQLFGFELTLRRVGRLLQGIVVLVYGLTGLDRGIGFDGGVLLFTSIIGTVFLFLGLYIVQATISFWTVETLEIMNTMTYGGVETAQYPMSIYRVWFRKFFTYVVPVVLVDFAPIAEAIGRGVMAPLLAWTGPATGPCFFFASLVFFRLGIRHYTSTGS